MRISIDDFVENNYIGDWVLDKDIYLSKDELLEELIIISENPEEFSFYIYDAIQEASYRGLEEELIETKLKRSFLVEKLNYDLNKILKRKI
jgi:hypothetical protein